MLEANVNNYTTEKKTVAKMYLRLQNKTRFEKYYTKR